MGMTARKQCLFGIANQILTLQPQHPLRVAVDGRSAAGKTTFADELGDAIEQAGRPIIRTSIDGFHNPRAVRYRQGRFSPDGYYEDARNLHAVRRLLLEPLGPGGTLLYATACFDLERDEALVPQILRAASTAVLIVDGTFLLRPELNSFWDYVIFLNVSEEDECRRGVMRDAELLGGEAAALNLYQTRYCPAFARYEAECCPREHADVVVDNTMFEAPVAAFRP